MRKQKQQLLDARHALFDSLLPALWRAKDKPAEPDEWFRPGPLKDGDVLVTFPWSECHVEDGEVVPPVEKVCMCLFVNMFNFFFPSLIPTQH